MPECVSRQDLTPSILAGTLRLPAIRIHRKANVPGQTSPPDPQDVALARQLLAATSDARVLVVGDAMLDRYISGEVARISPEAPVPVVSVEEDRVAVGGAGNVAAGIVALGAECRLVAAVGDDEAGRQLADALSALGVGDEGLLLCDDRPTTQKTRVMSGRQQMLRVDRESTSPLAASQVEGIERLAREALAESDVLVLQDYDKGAITPRLARALLDAAEEAGIPSVVDPKLRHFRDFAGAYLFKPNRRELAAGLGSEDVGLSDDDLVRVVDELRVRNLLVTLGAQGMILLGEDVAGVERIPSRAREVFDVTGAGDTVLAIVSVVLGTGGDLVMAARLATAGAGLGVSRLGAVAVTAAELLMEFSD